jgi:farnesyl diphosphate synthase
MAEMTERLKQALKETRQTIDDVIDRLIPRNNELENQLYDAMRYGTLEGGKRMRPLLVLASCDMFNVDRACAVRVAAAVEMVHSYSLIHDDLPALDDEALRRGRPTLHCEFDDATAILAGDALHSLAFEILADPDTHGDPHIRIKLVEGLARALGPRGMAGGQMIDTLGERGSELDVGAITRLQKMKTGALIMFACETGAILGRASPKHLMAIRNYAHDFGLAFQLTDDILDATGAVQDLRKDKSHVVRASFMSHYTNEAARAKATLLIDQAVRHLSVFETTRTEILVDLARFLIDRKN